MNIQNSSIFNYKVLIKNSLFKYILPFSTKLFSTKQTPIKYPWLYSTPISIQEKSFLQFFNTSTSTFDIHNYSYTCLFLVSDDENPNQYLSLGDAITIDKHSNLDALYYQFFGRINFHMSKYNTPDIQSFILQYKRIHDPSLYIQNNTLKPSTYKSHSYTYPIALNSIEKSILNIHPIASKLTIPNIPNTE
jgi:hypothetical protein